MDVSARDQRAVLAFVLGLIGGLLILLSLLLLLRTYVYPYDGFPFLFGTLGLLLGLLSGGMVLLGAAQTFRHPDQGVL